MVMRRFHEVCPVCGSKSALEFSSPILFKFNLIHQTVYCTKCKKRFNLRGNIRNWSYEV